MQYPRFPRREEVDVLHGVEVADPYRGLEADVRESEEVAAWVAAQNELTFGHLKAIPQREAILSRMTTLWDYEKYSSPTKAGQRYYFFKNDGLQNHAVLYGMDTLDGEPSAILDPNEWSEDGSVALSTYAFSDDGHWLCYGVMDGGSDWTTLKIRDLTRGVDLDDEIRWVKFSVPSWTPDGKGFFYGRFAQPEEGSDFQQLNHHHKLYFHQLHTPQEQDSLVYERPEQPTWGFSPHVSEDGRWLLIAVWEGTDRRNRLLIRDLTAPYAIPSALIDHFDNEYSYIANEGERFYFVTDLDAPKRRVVAIDRHAPETIHEIIAEREDTLEGVGCVGNLLIASYWRDARSHVEMYRMDGSSFREVSFPAMGTADGFGGRRTDTETFYQFTSFVTKPGIYRYDLLTGESTLMRESKVDFVPDDYVLSQAFVPSKDGTLVPAFIAHKKGITLDGTNPTLLYGYGGFSVSLTPAFSIVKLAWMELGGVFVMANLRGGGEYGEAWHQAGVGRYKQNVFDDCIAVAEWLIKEGYTNPARLALQGGSNGGLLVGAVMTQRPELFGACLPAVGVMDMLRFHKFTAGRYWVDDYGSPDDPEMFPTLLGYSPYHNIKPGVAYPATLVTTADTDDRVVPMHSFKFAAALQHAQTGDAPTLIRIETRAGHGAGKPTSKWIEEYTDLWAFLAEQFEIEVGG